MKYLNHVLTLSALLLFATVVFAAVDAAIVTVLKDNITAGVAAQIPYFSVKTLVLWFYPAWIAAAIYCVAWIARETHEKKRVWDGALVATAVAITVTVYITLIAYPPFAGHIPFVSAIVVWFFALLALYAVATRFRNRWLAIAAGVVTIGASFVVAYANYRQYHGLYATLHESIVYVTYTSTMVGAVVALWRVTFASRWLPTALFLISLVAFAAGYTAPESTFKKFRFYSEIGRVLPSQPKTLSVAASDIPPDPDALERFSYASGLPKLPDDFHVDDYNILLIGVDTERFDRTSLGGRFKTTPHLEKRAKQGFVSKRAYSPGSGTLHSMASFFTMKMVSSTQLSTWMRPFHGELSPAELTVTELLADVRYKNWWVGHNYDEVFSNSILGLNQGFESVDLYIEYANPAGVTTDAEVADLSIRKLRERAQRPDERFFGFIFFGAPHRPYVAHGYDMPKKTRHDRYLQEIRYTDDQFERVFEFLEESGLLEKTIVAFFSDHGEEFREHGALLHTNSVYSELIHVPFVVWVPGLEPSASDQPTSTMYLFPWLFLTAKDDGLRESTEAHLTNYLGPVLRETENAVIAELMGHDRLQATVISEEYKLVHDYRSELTQLFFLPRDPMEQIDLFDDPKHAKAKAVMTKRFDGYERVRAAFFKHEFLPKKRTPMHDHAKKLAKDRRAKKKKKAAKKKAAKKKAAKEKAAKEAAAKAKEK